MTNDKKGTSLKIQKIIREYIKKNKNKSDPDNPKAIEYLEQIRNSGTSKGDNIVESSTNLVHEISKITDDAKKVSVLKKIIQETRANPKSQKIILKQSVEALKHLPYKEKEKFINFCVYEQGKQNLYSEEKHEDRKEQERPLELYEKFLNFKSENIPSNQNILLVGGGKSQIRKALPMHNITNYDLTPVSHSDKIANTEIEGNFCTKLDDRVKNNHDQIWSLFSLPMYAESTTQIKGFFNNAVSSLKDGGIIRIFPIEHYGESASKNPSYSLITEELIEFEKNSINIMEQNPDLFKVEHHNEKIDKSMSKKNAKGITITVNDSLKAQEFLKSSLDKMELEFIEKHSRPKKAKPQILRK